MAGRPAPDVRPVPGARGRGELWISFDLYERIVDVSVALRVATRLRLIPKHRERRVGATGARHARADDRTVRLNRDAKRPVSKRFLGGAGNDECFVSAGGGPDRLDGD